MDVRACTRPQLSCVAKYASTSVAPVTQPAACSFNKALQPTTSIYGENLDVVQNGADACAVAVELMARRHGSYLAEKLEPRSEEHTSELQSPKDLLCRLLLEKKEDHT